MTEEGSKPGLDDEAQQEHREVQLVLAKSRLFLLPLSPSHLTSLTLALSVPNDDGTARSRKQRKGGGTWR